MISVTLWIIIITTAVSLAGFSKEKIKEDLLFWPAMIKSRRQYYRFLTGGLIHGDLMHLAFNMISLLSFGEFLESGFLFSSSEYFGANGKWVYLLLYILALVVSVIPDYISYQDNYAYRALGASGAVSAVIFSFIMLRPTMELRLFFSIPIPGYIFGALFLGISVYLSRRGGDNIGHRAHFSGAIFGVLFTIIACKLLAHIDILPEFWRQVSARY
ncbi:MAG TPA: rhomboid family intramembrane serine protease [Flavihumibacter sp.]|nr:rhomboid family intramembrane serine protease [Bacteroidota bacterium]HOA37283.1 rhomboid family intramembrane serine protease [Flavihumibacter sp.]HPZ87357.1 rhomboid family intramembrane serine protease [Flavihumibacter sp.]HQD10449.1 rhomboid family intramembrane serine protease [Flavihumibacter sp.]